MLRVIPKFSYGVKYINNPFWVTISTESLAKWSVLLVHTFYSFFSHLQTCAKSGTNLAMPVTQLKIV